MRGPLPTPLPGEAKPARSLVASAERLREACEGFLGDLENLARELEEQKPDLDAVEESLSRVRQSLDQLSEPRPPGPKESTPPEPRQP